MESCTRHCIVTFMDLAGTRKEIDDDSAIATGIMRNFHQAVYNETINEMPTHEHSYTWNDSVLLLAYTDGAYTNITKIMKEADNLKKKVDRIKKCYAISVKGMSFSEPCYCSGNLFEGSNIEQPKFVYLKASSYAFSNCYDIERKLGKKHKKNWYVDDRIVKNSQIEESSVTDKFTMLPENEKRRIHMYDNYLWVNE